MHPLLEYQQSQSKSDWDKTLLSWMLSEKPLEAFEATQKLFNEIIDFWIKVAPKYKIDLKVQRGIQFDHIPKKAPKKKKHRGF